MDAFKPSKAEDEYFVKQDLELIRAQRARLDAERARAERASHYMRCPKCGAQLAEIEFHHIKIDKCEECGGMWFDKGELEMLQHVDQGRIRGFLRSMLGLG
jgi:ribosomal protein L37AE/L43A